MLTSALGLIIMRLVCLRRLMVRIKINMLATLNFSLCLDSALRISFNSLLS